jgi:hypothetical protein
MAEDKYWSVALIVQDADLQQRVIAAAAKEDIPEPSYWAMSHVWDYAAQPGWGEKYQYAIDSLNPNPGRDDSVITDGDILTAVQAIRNEEEAA